MELMARRPENDVTNERQFRSARMARLLTSQQRIIHFLRNYNRLSPLSRPRTINKDAANGCAADGDDVSRSSIMSAQTTSRVFSLFLAPDGNYDDKLSFEPELL